MELTTARLFLRPFRPDDHAALHAIAGNPEVVRWMDWGPNTPAFLLVSKTEKPRRT